MIFQEFFEALSESTLFLWVNSTLTRKVLFRKKLYFATILRSILNSFFRCMSKRTYRKRLPWHIQEYKTLNSLEPSSYSKVSVPEEYVDLAYELLHVIDSLLEEKNFSEELKLRITQSYLKNKEIHIKITLQ